MNRYLAVFRGGTRPPGIVDAATGKYFARDYGDVAIGATVRWLNERDKGYPTVYPLEDFDEHLQRRESVV